MKILKAWVVALCLLTACASEDTQATHDAPSPSLSANGQEDIQSHLLADRLEAELTIEGQPDWMTIGYGSVWVLIDEAAAIGRIDPATNELVATIEVGEHPCDGMAAAFGAIWVPSCSRDKLFRVSAQNEKVEASIDIPVFQSLPGTGPFGGIAAGAGAVWMVTEGDKGTFDTLARIDPRTNKITDMIPLRHLGGGVVVGESAVWVTAPEDGLLLRVDPDSREVTDEVKGLAQPASVAIGDGGVWVLSGTWSDNPDGDGSVTRVDPATNEIVASIKIDDTPGQAAEITVGSGSVWARTQYTLLVRIDPATNTVVERYEDQKGLGGVRAAFGSVWLSDLAFNRVWRLPLDAS